MRMQKRKSMYHTIQAFILRCSTKLVKLNGTSNRGLTLLPFANYDFKPRLMQTSLFPTFRPGHSEACDVKNGTNTN